MAVAQECGLRGALTQRPAERRGLAQHAHLVEREAQEDHQLVEFEGLGEVVDDAVALRVDDRLAVVGAQRASDDFAYQEPTRRDAAGLAPRRSGMPISNADAVVAAERTRIVQQGVQGAVRRALPVDASQRTEKRV